MVVCLRVAGSIKNYSENRMPRCKVKDCRAKLPKDAPPWQEVCSIACSLVWLEVKKAKARALQAKRSKKERYEKVRNFRMQERPHQLRLTQSVFNRFIRLLDKDQGCITCLKPASWQGQWHAGHWKTTKARSDLRFCPLNVHKQCSECNNFHSGRADEYEKRLAEMYGQAVIDYLNTDLGPLTLSGEQLAKMRRTFAAECRLLESGQPPSRNWRAL
jgi:hypothetical protein